MKYLFNPIFPNYFNFSGRATRKEFWLFHAWFLILSGVMPILLLLAALSQDLPYLLLPAVFLYLVFPLLIAIPQLALGARRLHDTGRSGWWLLLIFVPIIGWIALIVFFASPTVD